MPSHSFLNHKRSGVLKNQTAKKLLRFIHILIKKGSYRGVLYFLWFCAKFVNSDHCVGMVFLQEQQMTSLSSFFYCQIFNLCANIFHFAKGFRLEDGARLFPFSTVILNQNLYFLGGSWAIVSISPTFYAQLLCTKVLDAGFFLLIT